MIAIAALLVATAVVSAAGTGVVRRYALRRGMIDTPNARSSHEVPTPRGGGMAIAVACAVSLAGAFVVDVIDASTLLILLAPAAGAAALGFLDDHTDLSAKLRFPLHLAIGGAFVALSPALPPLRLGEWALDLGWVGAAICVVGVAWVLNLFNFMDGIDGIAGTEAMFVGGAGAALLWVAGEPQLAVGLAVAAAGAAGFLVWNWPPAKIFMGDAGSGFLGALFGGFVVFSAAPLGSVWPALILLGVFIVDATVTLASRAASGERWFEAHRSHAYQRLSRRFGHRAVTLGVCGINLVWGLPWAVLAWRFPSWSSVCCVAATLPYVVATLRIRATVP